MQEKILRSKNSFFSIWQLRRVEIKMTEMLYLEDSYLKEFDAKIAEIINDKFVILDKTAFYPESGGQLCDMGKLIAGSKEYEVLNVKKDKGKIFHELNSIEGLSINSLVHGRIDWQRRYVLMQMHTAAHILSAIIHQATNALITGNQLGLEQSRIDFNLEHFDREALKEHIKSANEIVKWNLPIKAYFVPFDQLLNDSLCKLAKGLPPGLKEVRIVEIENFDKQADAGTHVKSTSEVGSIKLIRTENKGKDNRRIYFGFGLKNI